MILVFAGSVVAQTSLFIPGFDSQAISASEAGVGPDGTTWVIVPGEATGAYSDEDAGFFGPATLVAGASSVGLVYVDPTYSISESCDYGNGVAICGVAYAMSGVTTMTTTVTEPIESLAVQGGGSTTQTPGGSVTTSVPTNAPTTGSGTSHSAGSSTSSAASQTHTANGAARHDLSFAFVLGIVGTIFMVLI